MKYINGKDTKNEIIKQSKKLFFANGFKNTGIRQIAKAANVTSGALYRHFNSKEDILDAIISPYTDDWLMRCENIHRQFNEEIKKAKDKEEIKKLLLREESHWFYNYIKQNADIWEFVLFKSEGTKYNDYFDNYVKFEADLTIKLLQEIDKEKNYLKVASDIEIYYVIKNVYTMALSLFDKNFDEQRRINFLGIIEDMNKSFWKKIFTINK